MKFLKRQFWRELEVNLGDGGHTTSPENSIDKKQDKYRMCESSRLASNAQSYDELSNITGNKPRWRGLGIARLKNCNPSSRKEATNAGSTFFSSLYRVSSQRNPSARLVTS